MGIENKRSSRVIHARIEDFVTLGCYNLLRSKGMDIANLPMSSAVSAVLEVIITNMMDEGVINPIYGVSATHQLNAIIGVREKQELDFSSVDFSKYMPTSEDEIEEELKQSLEHPEKDNILSTISQIAASLEHEDKYRDDEKLFSPSENLSPDPDQVADTSIPPWERDGVLSWEAIEEECPMDVIVIETLENGTERDKRALQLAYSNLNPIDWGTDRARTLILQCYKQISKYFEKPIDN